MASMVRRRSGRSPAHRPAPTLRHLLQPTIFRRPQRPHDPQREHPNMSRKFFALIMMAMLAACSAKPVITNVSVVEPGATISGVPVRVKTEQVVHIFRLNPDAERDDDRYTEVSSIHQVLADQTRLFA